MRIKSLVREVLSAELLLLWLFKGTVASFLVPSQNGVFKFNYQNSIITSHFIQLTLVGLTMPWITSVESVTVGKKRRSKTNGRNSTTTTIGTSTTTPVPSTTTSTKRGKRKSKNLPQKQTSANNALLANIDFLTHLTNTKLEKNAEMDPLKCFPKALCGLSAESAAITRRRKNGLISDYIRLMKAVALNPSVMDKTLKKLKAHEDNQQQDDVPKDSVESDEDREDDDDEDEDDETERRSESSLKKRTNYGYGYGSSSSAKVEPNVEDDGPAKKRTKRKEIIPKDSDEFTRQFIAEKAHVERLIEDGFYHEDTDDTNWWNYEKEKDPELEDLVDNSGGRLDSSSHESYYTFGAKRKPQPPMPPQIPETPIVPPAPIVPHMGALEAPPRLRPPKTPSVKTPDSEASGTVSTIGRFFRSLFGFSSSNAPFTSDPFFSGFQRSLPDGTPTVVTVDKTKEILTTAIEIGETLRSPNQCNSLFNGCRYQYIELLHVIDDIRQSLAERGKDDYQSAQLYTGIDEDNDSDAKTGDTQSSYGYKSRLSEASQAETLSPDYGIAASAITQKNGRKKSRKSYRGGALSSVSRESSVEIGSDEPTMYGSAQENFDYYQNQYHRNGHSHEHRHRNEHSHHSHYGSYQQPSYQFEDVHVRQPKTIWGTILSWFGFR